MKSSRNFQSAKEPSLNEAGISSHIILLVAFLIWLTALVLGVKPVHANNQHKVAIEIKNQQFDNGKLYFDVYLRQTGDSVVFLGYSDIVIKFPGSVVPSKMQYVGGSNQFFTASGLYAFGYEQGLFSKVKADGGHTYAIINIFSPDFSNAADFELQIARIDKRENMHRIGRFFLGGVESTFNLNNAGLSLVTPGMRTMVHGYDPERGFNMSEVEFAFLVGLPGTSNPIWKFEAQRQGDGIAVEWELNGNVNAYSVEKSFDGKNWELLEQPPVEVTAGLFSLADRNPAGARLVRGEINLAYRLKVIGTNGRSYYSAVKEISYHQGISLVAFPNPVADQLQLRFTDGELSSFVAAVYSSEGRLVKELSGFNASEIALDLSMLHAGQYTVRVIAGNEAGTARIVVVR